MSGLLAMICGAGGGDIAPSILSFTTDGSWSQYVHYRYVYYDDGNYANGDNYFQVIASGSNLQYQWESATRVPLYSSGTNCTGAYYNTNVSDWWGNWTQSNTSNLRLIGNGWYIWSYVSGWGPQEYYWKSSVYVRCKVWNSAGTVYTPWIRVIVKWGRYVSGSLGYNCNPCSYDCNCDCYNEENCCCYDSNGDGITCCDVNNGDVSACCRGDQCGYSYNCYNCQTCWNYCSWGCNDNPCWHSCQWYEDQYDYYYESGFYYC